MSSDIPTARKLLGEALEALDERVQAYHLRFALS